MNNPVQRGPEGVWREMEPIGPQGPFAKLEFWLRAKGFVRIAAALGRFDERGL